MHDRQTTNDIECFFRIDDFVSEIVLTFLSQHFLVFFAELRTFLLLAF